MARIETGGRLGPAQVRPVRDVPDATERTRPASEGTAGRALVAIDGGRRDQPGPGAAGDPPAAGRSRAGFLTQILTASDPTLLPSRLERTRSAAARYAEMARRLA